MDFNFTIIDSIVQNWIQFSSGNLNLANLRYFYGQQPTRLLHPQDSLGKNTGVGCHFLLQTRHIYLELNVFCHDI